MVNDLVMAATGQPTVASAWGSLVKPSDVVGIKVCTNGAPLFSSHPAVVNAIVAGLAEAGVPPQNIVVWDREESLLKSGRFSGKECRLPLDVERRELRPEGGDHLAGQWKTDLRRPSFYGKSP